MESDTSNLPETRNLTPIFEHLVSREEKEQLLGQQGKVLWFTGLSGSGKSTIAQGVERELFSLGYVVQVLDGDNIRTGLNNNLGFSIEDRQENIRRIAEAAKLFAESGIICICSFVSPTIEIRAMAKEIIGIQDFVEIFVDTPLEECERRDVKGLYAKARAGEIKGFTGIDSPYEAPVDPDLIIKTMERNVEESIYLVMELLDVDQTEEIGQIEEIDTMDQDLEKYNDSTLKEQKVDYGKFEDMYVWKASIQLAKLVYHHFDHSNVYSLKDQLLKTSISISSNIAEGFERQTNKEFIRFLYIAKASCGELRSQIHLSKELNIIQKAEADQLLKRAYGVSAMLHKLIRYRSSLEKK